MLLDLASQAEKDDQSTLQRNLAHMESRSVRSGVAERLNNNAADYTMTANDLRHLLRQGVAQRRTGTDEEDIGLESTQQEKPADTQTVQSGKHVGAAPAGKLSQLAAPPMPVASMAEDYCDMSDANRPTMPARGSAKLLEWDSSDMPVLQNGMPPLLKLPAAGHRPPPPMPPSPRQSDEFSRKLESAVLFNDTSYLPMSAAHSSGGFPSAAFGMSNRPSNTRPSKATDGENSEISKSRKVLADQPLWA